MAGNADTATGAPGLADFMDGPAEEGLTAAAGAPLQGPKGRADREAVIEALKDRSRSGNPGEYLRSGPDL